MRAYGTPLSPGATTTRATGTIHPFLMRRCRANAPRIGDARTHRGRNTNVMSTNGGRFERPLPMLTDPGHKTRDGPWVTRNGAAAVGFYNGTRCCEVAQERNDTGMINLPAEVMDKASQYAGPQRPLIRTGRFGLKAANRFGYTRSTICGDKGG